ncbi:hypothetical protein ILUMI_20840 [Ignelater luminosus]|uniref:Zinc finger PHD-type domain-containing protein n=1 Tax=Ignelater luminosus TaxID=2038154 RepID=A0A8K0CHS3_IGNLU|nr:hypothetical protein ILUMI_20840 [Ignelater luminosus]
MLLVSSILHTLQYAEWTWHNQRLNVRRSEQSKVPTSSPYKNELLERKRVAGKKKQAAVTRKLEKDAKKNEMGSKGRKSGASQLSKIADEGNKTNKKRQKKLDCGGNKETTGHDTTCIICLESFEEEWVQYIECKQWAHIGCVDQQHILYFICDFCKM